MKERFILVCILLICSVCVADDSVIQGQNGFMPSPFITPGDFSKSDYAFSYDSNGMKVEIDKVAYRIASRFSDSKGRWIKFDASALKLGGNGIYSANFASENWKIERRVELKGNHIAVFDTITNTADKLIAVRLDNNITPIGECSPLSTVAGSYKAPKEENGPERPFVHVISGQTSVGMIARDDVYMNQMVTYGKDKTFGIKDDYFGLDAKKSYTVKWEIYPCQTSNYYEFINHARNVWGTDKALIPQLFAFIYPHRVWEKTNKTLYQMTVDEIRDWLDTNKVNAICFIVMSDDDPRPELPIEAFGDDYIFNSKLSREYWHQVVDKIKAAKPEVDVVPYTHFGIGRPDLKGYDDCRMMLRGNERKLFFNYLNIQRDFFYPTATNKFGKLMDQMFDMVKDEWGPKAYLDESSFGNRSVYLYGVPDWDGCSVDVNLTTNEPIEKVTNVALITRSFSDKIMDRMICCNWLQTTERDIQRMIPSFIEHFHAGTAPRAHLTTPLVTGGQIAKSNEDVAKEVYGALSEGILYFHIGNSAYAETTPSLLGHFYPIRAKEVWPGAVVGPEKIITIKSGYYGFNDQSDMEVYVYDSKGIIKQHKGKPFIKDNKKYTELQLGAGEIAIIKKK